MVGSSKQVRYQTDQKQNNKDEKENPGNLRRGKRYHSETKDARD
jgi:hypothetical protein